MAAEIDSDLPVAFKMLMIAAANVVILCVSLVCLHVGFSRTGEKPPSSPIFIWGTVVIIVISTLLSPALNMVRNGYRRTVELNAGRPSPPGGGRSPSDSNQTLAEEPTYDSRGVINPRWYESETFTNTALWGLALGNFITIGALVQTTGGVVSSPFNQFAVAIVVLSPYIMTGRNTPLRMLIGGLIYYGVLLLIEPLTASLSHPPGRGTYFAITSVIFVVSVVFIKQVRDVTWDEPDDRSRDGSDHPED